MLQMEMVVVEATVPGLLKASLALGFECEWLQIEEPDGDVPLEGLIL